MQLKEEYENNTKLIVTSRLHCAAPCIARGIPTIIVRKYSGYTFEWIKQYVKIYDPSNVKDISWRAYEYEYNVEEAKRKMLGVACHFIKKAWEDNYQFQIEDFYTTYRNVELKYDNTQKMNDEKLKRILNVVIRSGYNEYCIWGISENAEDIYQYLKKRNRI